MGNTHYVYIYVQHPEDGKYYYTEYYRGESFFAALRAFIRSRKLTKSRKWEWRG